MDGVVQPAPSPRFNRTKPTLTHSSRIPGQDGREVLLGAGLSDSEVDELISQKVVTLPEAH